MHRHASRRDFIALLAGIAAAASTGAAAAYEPQLPLVRLAPGVAYVPGDIERALTCNTGVITSRGRLSLVDAAIPDGAAAAYRAIRARTSLPFARTIDTHYHLDHTYGNAFWGDHGAKPIAVDGLQHELAKAEPDLRRRPGTVAADVRKAAVAPFVPPLSTFTRA